MNSVFARAPYQSSSAQVQNNEQPARALTAPYVANVAGAEFKFQPIPTFSFTPATSATIAVRITPLPGGPSVGASATARFLPEITMGPNELGGLNVTVTPKMQLELNADLAVGIPNIFGSGVGVRGGVSGSMWYTFEAPQGSFNLNPDLSFNIGANFNPALTTTQRIGINGGGQGSVSSSGVSAGASVDQSFTHQTQQQIKLGGPGVKFDMTSTGIPTITTNHDKTVSITNTYSFVPRTSASANVQVGPVTVNGGVGVTPGVTVRYKVTLSTDLTSQKPIRTELSVTPGVRVDGTLGAGISLFPKEWPVSLNASFAFNPYAGASVGGSVSA